MVFGIQMNIGQITSFSSGKKNLGTEFIGFFYDAFFHLFRQKYGTKQPRCSSSDNKYVIDLHVTQVCYLTKSLLF